jgi:phosphate-selective porin
MFDIAKVQDSNDRASDTVLQDLYVSYLLNKSKKNSSYIDVGQQKVPIGYESLLSASALPFVERSLFAQLRDPLRANYDSGRDTGAQLRGTAGQFDYRIGIFNGFGDRQNGLAYSDAKAVIGQLAYHVTPAWQIGASAARGNTGISSSGVRADRHLWNLFTAYKHDKFSLQGEYLDGDYSDPVNGTQDVRSYYGNAGYFLTPKLEGVARADFFDYKNLNATIKQYTLGLNYYLKGNNAKIQLNLVHTDGDPAAPGSTFDNDSNELRTLFQVAF